MKLARTYSISLYGLLGRSIEVEADISSNLPGFVLVGLPDASLNESTARVRAATTNSGLALPARKITVNLSPASVPKHGSSFDLAIAVAALCAAGTIKSVELANTVFLGELALDGSIKPVSGILPSVLSAKQLGFKKVVVPLANVEEAQIVDDLEIFGFDHLTQLAAKLGAKCEIRPTLFVPKVHEKPRNMPLDFSDVYGQDEAIEALTVAAAGGHHFMMIGPPGAGKTMLASRLPSILPSLTKEELVENLAIQSLAKLELNHNLDLVPFQAPHQNASMAAMVGGGSGQPRPGIISLANNGVLFLDEAPEFQMPVLDSLRQSLETGLVTISRASGQAVFPANFQLVMAANPCPCGFAVGTGKSCTCTASAKAKYQARISGPLSDRIDIRLELNQVNTKQIKAGLPGTGSELLKGRVIAARARSALRLAGTPWKLNSRIPGTYLRRELRLPSSVTTRLDAALDRSAITMRGYDRTLRVAWTIADLEGRPTPSSEDLNLAMFYRGA